MQPNYRKINRKYKNKNKRDKFSKERDKTSPIKKRINAQVQHLCLTKATLKGKLTIKIKQVELIFESYTLNIL